MKLIEVSNQDIIPEIGKCYRLRDNLGDYSLNTVLVEKGPRGFGPTEQYRVSWGTGNYDVDWIDTSYFAGSIEVPEPPGLRYQKDSNNSDK